MKYVYMIDYEDKYGQDQIECINAQDLIQTLKCTFKGEKEKEINYIKKVMKEDRWIEENISKPLLEKCKKILKYKPKYN